MRVCVTEAASRRGRSVARLLAAAGHRVVGIATEPDPLASPVLDLRRPPPADDLEPPYPAAFLDDTLAGCAALLVLGGDPVAVRDLGAAAGRAGIRVVLLSGAEPALRVPEPVLQAAGVPALVVRAAPTAGRRAGPDAIRTLAGVLHGGAGTGWQLLHDDDLDRFLVAAVLGDRTGVVDLAGPGTVTGAQARELLGDVGRFSARGLPRAEPAPAADLPAEWEVRPGWGAREVLADLARGLPGRRPSGWRRRILPAGAEEDPEAVPLPVDVLPGGSPPVDGQPLVPPPGPAGEFDDPVDDRFALAAAWTGFPARPLTPLSLDLQVGALRQAAAATARVIGLTGLVAGEWTGRLATVHGHRVYRNVSVGVVVASVLPEPYGAGLLHRAVAGVPDGLVPPVDDFTAGAAARNAAARRLRRIAGGFGRWVSLIEAAGRTEVLAPAQLTGLDDDGLHVRCLLWRDRLGHACAIAAVGAVLAGDAGGSGGDADPEGGAPAGESTGAAGPAVAAFTAALRAGTAERARRLAAAGVLASPSDGPYLTLDELFGPPADVRERVARRRSERARLAAAPLPDVLAPAGVAGPA